jgi:hypothetical protein
MLIGQIVPSFILSDTIKIARLFAENTIKSRKVYVLLFFAEQMKFENTKFVWFGE